MRACALHTEPKPPAMPYEYWRPSIVKDTCGLHSDTRALGQVSSAADGHRKIVRKICSWIRKCWFQWCSDKPHLSATDLLDPRAFHWGIAQLRISTRHFSYWQGAIEKRSCEGDGHASEDSHGFNRRWVFVHGLEYRVLEGGGGHGCK